MPEWTRRRTCFWSSRTCQSRSACQADHETCSPGCTQLRHTGRNMQCFYFYFLFFFTHTFSALFIYTPDVLISILKRSFPIIFAFYHHFVSSFKSLESNEKMKELGLNNKLKRECVLCSATHSRGCSNNSVREHKQVEPHQLEYVLKEPNDLQRQHVLPTKKITRNEHRGIPKSCGPETFKRRRTCLQSSPTLKMAACQQTFWTPSEFSSSSSTESLRHRRPGTKHSRQVCSQEWSNDQ